MHKLTLNRALAAILLAAVAIAPSLPAADKDAPKLEGTWEVTSYSGFGPLLVVPGQLGRPDVTSFTDNRIVIQKDTLTWTFVPPTGTQGGWAHGVADGSVSLGWETNPPPARLVQKHTFALPAGTPKGIDLTVLKEGKPTKSVLKGIYELTGDTLTISLARDDSPRPTELSVPSSDLTRFMFVLKRKKP